MSVQDPLKYRKQEIVFETGVSKDATVESMSGDSDYDHDALSPWLYVFFFFCGISMFARSEAFLMQTQLFGDCFGLGKNFYAFGSSALFMPGILVQFFQNRYDATFDAKYGALKAITFRFASSVILSVIALAIFLSCCYVYESLRESPAFVYPMMMIIGLCISINFGSFTQVVSLFPPRIQPFFFVGTFAPFFIFAPVNAGVKDLCAMGRGSTKWDIRWTSVLVYYVVAVIITLLGLVGYFGLIFHPLGRSRFHKKDADLARSNSIASFESINAPTEATSLLKSSSSSLSSSTSNQSCSSTLSILKRIWPVAIAQMVTVITSTLIAAVYIDFRYGRFDDLTTVLMYDYYVAAAIGTILSSWSRVRRLMTNKAIVILTILRCGFIPLTFCYAFDVIPQVDDLIPIALNTVQMIMSGLLFTASFCNATNTFEDETTKALAGTVMNVLYYIAMALGTLLSLPLHS